MLYNVKTLKGLTALGDISLAVHTNEIYKQGIRDRAYEPARKKYSGARNGIIRERLFLHFLNFIQVLAFHYGLFVL